MHLAASQTVPLVAMLVVGKRVPERGDSRCNGHVNGTGAKVSDKMWIPTWPENTSRSIEAAFHYVVVTTVLLFLTLEAPVFTLQQHQCIKISDTAAPV